MMIFDPSRHEPLGDAAWDEPRARDAIAAVCRDAEAAFDAERLWPLHPADEEPGTPAGAIVHGLYLGAAGIVHGLARLAEAGLHEPRLDLAAIAAGLPGAPPDEPGADASLLLGASGILLVAHRLAPSAATADALAEVIAGNAGHPSNELLLGSPGTLLAARAMHARTGEERFAALARESAQTLLARQEPDGLWTQDLYGSRERLVGAGHGFAGNVLALGSFMDEARAVEVAKRLALRDDDRVNWPALDIGWGGSAPRVQWCHGAPGIITSLGGLAPGDEEFTALLAAGGELTWLAGPVAHNAGLCHGAAGNGFAFLTLLERTGDELWLQRARAFAMHALAQADRLRAASGPGHYSLFTGDLGPALLAAACLDPDPRFPGLDDL
jgi:hypothetical protein